MFFTDTYLPPQQASRNSPDAAELQVSAPLGLRHPAARDARGVLVEIVAATDDALTLRGREQLIPGRAIGAGIGLERIGAVLTELAQEIVDAYKREGAAITTRENTVYYVIGTRAELKERGVIKEEGGTRFLIFTRTGEVLKPGDNLDPAGFTAVDRRTVTEIKLPDPNKEYQLVSNQNIAYSNIPLDAKGRIRGSLQISSPDRFWGQHRFLILVER